MPWALEWESLEGLDLFGPEQTHQWACSREGMLSLDSGFKRTHLKLTGNAFSTTRCCNSGL